MSRPLRFHTTSPDQTRRLGEIIGKYAQSGDVFLLNGPLGAGKTCLTQGIAQGLGVVGNVRSPTFVLMTQHKGRLTLHHVDLYRIGGPAEAWDLGLDEQTSGEGASGDSICVVEWADRAGRASGVFPPDALWLDLSYGGGEDDRVIEITPGPARYRPLLKALSDSFKSSLQQPT